MYIATPVDLLYGKSGGRLHRLELSRPQFFRALLSSPPFLYSLAPSGACVFFLR